MARYYSPTMQPTLFGEISLVRNWGRIGTTGQQKVDTFPHYTELERAYEELSRQKRRKGYRCTADLDAFQKCPYTDARLVAKRTGGRCAREVPQRQFRQAE
ncbi:WGR domain-containing protein [Phyllobacterium sp. OV277]|nr:WGR domain-containing protein [Phyllobacterium sp. OV277]